VRRKKEKTKYEGSCFQLIDANAHGQEDIPAHQEQYLQVFKFQEMLRASGRTRVLTNLIAGAGTAL
jgi:hypothetical protein